ncbi:MAG TPA: hypothetical protein ENI29_07960, partial [bacterium]|nr:hypothetical protein [bacterium]
MNHKQIRDVLLIFWMLIITFNFIVIIQKPSIINLFVLGVASGFFLHMLIVNPLLDSHERLNRYLKRFNSDLIKLNAKLYKENTEKQNGK